jgi:hypothetical protein
MATVTRTILPPHALLARYRRAGIFSDCYTATLPLRVTQEQYVRAFYTTALFRLERALLARLLACPSSDAQAAALAAGSDENFAFWRVEARAANQLLLCDLHGRTRSWLMLEEDGQGSRLFFGSAVLPRPARGDGAPRFGILFWLLSGFHRLYARGLLYSARRALLLALSK